MIADYLLPYTHPLWMLACAAEFALGLWFVRPFATRDERAAATSLLTLLSCALWYGVHLLHLSSFAGDYVLNVAAFSLYDLASRHVRGGQAVYVACVFVLCLEIGKIACVDLVMQPAFDVLVEMPAACLTLMWACVQLLVAFACLFAVSRRMFRWPIEYLSWRQMALVLFPLIPYIYIRSSSYMFSTTDRKLYWDMVLVALLLGAATLAAVIANAQTLAAEVKRREVAQMSGLLSEQRARYAAQRDAEDALRLRYHDLKHYATELEALAATAGADGWKELRQLAGSLRGELEACEHVVETGNVALDALLSRKRDACVRLDIRPIFYTDAAHLDFINSFDLCALFGNLLDNAIEAASEVGDARLREIVLDVRQSRGFSVTCCRNPFVGERRREGDGFASTKGTGPDHGHGLKSIRAIAERYGGSFDAVAEGGEFVATVAIPVPGWAATPRAPFPSRPPPSACRHHGRRRATSGHAKEGRRRQRRRPRTSGQDSRRRAVASLT